MTNPAMELLTASAYPQVAAALRKRLPHIIERWQMTVRQRLPKADELTFLQLRDDVPELIGQLAKTMETAAEGHAKELFEITAAHGAVRFHQSYDLNELMVEYTLLRPIVLEEVMVDLGRPVTVDEMVALNAGLDMSVRRSVVSFVSFQAKELQSATEAQSKYLSFLSHDLRGGLNGVFLMIEVLKRELVNEPRLAETVQDLDAMRRSLLETVGTMDRFLHAERFRKGKVQIKPAPVNLAALLSEQAAHFNYQAKDKGIDLRVETDPDCVLVSDRELLTLIFQNLLSNAVKYTQKGTVQVTGKPAPEGGCIVTVRDSGPGIAPEQLSKLFGPFTRGDTHGQPGVGLGLSIARQAAGMLGAKVWADSQFGKGSTFSVQIPKEAPKPAETPAKA